MAGGGFGTGSFSPEPYGLGDGAGPGVFLTPPDGSVGVPGGVIIQIDIIDPAGVDVGQTTVNIGGTPAFDGSLAIPFLGPFNYGFSSFVAIAGGVRLFLDQAPNYPPGVLSVVVLTKDALGNATGFEGFLEILSGAAGVTPFNFQPGARQWRIDPEGDAPHGTFVFALGHETPGHSYALLPGDRVQVSQAVNLTGLRFIKPKLRLKGPVRVPPGLEWQVSFQVGGVDSMRRSVPVGTDVLLDDVAANVSNLAGSHVLTFMLELAEAP